MPPPPPPPSLPKLCCAFLLPLQWAAPEVLAAGEAGRESDVYMLGGLMYELLTSGVAPYHWQAGYPQRLRPDNVLRAAELDQVQIPWCIRSRSPDCLQRLKALMSRCLEGEPRERPTLGVLLESARDLRAAEEAAVAPGQVEAEYVRR